MNEQNTNTDYRKSHTKQILIILAVVVIFTIARRYISGGGDSIAMSFQDTCMEFTAHTADEAQEDYVVRINYADVKNIETMSGIDLGTCLEGGETKTLRYGLWQNDQFGKYHLESYNTSTVYSVITTGDSVYVINLSVDEESEGMTAAFQKLLNQKLQGE